MSGNFISGPQWELCLFNMRGRVYFGPFSDGVPCGFLILPRSHLHCLLRVSNCIVVAQFSLLLDVFACFVVIVSLLLCLEQSFGFIALLETGQWC